MSRSGTEITNMTPRYFWILSSWKRPGGRFIILSSSCWSWSCWSDGGELGLTTTAASNSSAEEGDLYRIWPFPPAAAVAGAFRDCASCIGSSSYLLCTPIAISALTVRPPHHDRRRRADPPPRGREILLRGGSRTPGRCRPAAMRIRIDGGGGRIGAPASARFLKKSSRDLSLSLLSS